MDRNSGDEPLFREIHELASAQLMGHASAADVARLEAILTGNSEARRVYAEYISETAVLLNWASQELGRTLESNVNAEAVLELLEESEQEERVEAQRRAADQAKAELEAAERRRRMQEDADRRRARRPEPIVIPHSVAYAGAAVLFASVLWVAIRMLPSGDGELASDDPPAVTQQPMVATLVDSLDAQLVSTSGNGDAEAEQAISTIAGTQLAAGGYRLTRGVVQLEFDRGASVVVEGPATLMLNSADRLRLDRGRLVGNVPPAAIGFTVQTPTSTVVDLGTEFGVAALDGQAADITVFDGEVEVVAATTAGDANQQDPKVQRRRLTVDTSVRVDSTGAFVVAETRSSLYFRAVPSRKQFQQKAAYEKWLAHSEKLATDPDMVAYYTFNDQQPGDEFLMNRAGDGTSHHGDIVGADWAEGRWPQKQALRFGDAGANDNPPNYVQVDIPGRFDELTVCAWVNIVNLTPGMQGILMSDGVSPDGRLHWQITHDGRIQAGFYPSARSFGVMGAADVPLQYGDLGKWRQLAVVCQTKPAQVTYYIDGRRIGVKAERFHDEIALESSRIGGWKPISVHAPTELRTLHGRIDELAVFKRVLLDEEILAMYMEGKP